MPNKPLDLSRCQGIANSGERCKKRGRFPRGFCPLHISQAKRRGFGNYATAAGAAAATVTVIEKILEWLPLITGHTPQNGGFKEEILDLLETGNFREIDRAIATKSWMVPPRLKEKARRHAVRFHALQPQLDRLNESERRTLGAEVSKMLDLDSRR
ncbi:DUF5763 domain-containing protein [Hoeflea sp.]|uniref:DUF5763 domain-containing protein n=1 Tax=Hoeflea sp. TaxID=1940281 RepID=UPI003A93B419